MHSKNTPKSLPNRLIFFSTPENHAEAPTPKSEEKSHETDEGRKKIVDKALELLEDTRVPEAQRKRIDEMLAKYADLNDKSSEQEISARAKALADALETNLAPSPEAPQKTSAEISPTPPSNPESTAPKSEATGLESPEEEAGPDWGLEAIEQAKNFVIALNALGTDIDPQRKAAKVFLEERLGNWQYTVDSYKNGLITKDKYEKSAADFVQLDTPNLTDEKAINRSILSVLQENKITVLKPENLSS